MSGIYDLTGKNIENTYQRVVQTPDGINYYDGTGSLLPLSSSFISGASAAGNTITFTRGDGSTFPVTVAGGTGAPGGPNTSVQFNGNGVFSGSNVFTFNSASNALTLTGSLNITGSTTQIGTNNLFGNTTLSGSIIISGSSTTPTVQIYGNTTHNGYLRFDPVTTNIDPTISASYIYVSGSTNDLYFTQNGSGYGNTTRLRWLEGNLYTGLLNGGIVSQVNSNTYRISSGSGVIVTMNASYNDNPYPTVQYLNWGNLTNTIDALSGSFDQQFVAISSSAGTAVIKAQGTPYSDGDYNNFIPIGIVIHQNHSSINAVQTFPGVGYGWKQRSFDFIKAFGPLKIAGYTLAQSGSSTRGLVLSGGTAWVDGRNYIVDPNNPSYIVEATGITTSKIYRYYQSGSQWGYDTNGGVGYTDIDPTQYSNNGILTPVSSNNWTIQRVFYFPNSATKAFYIYYGNAQYGSQAAALAALATEPFSEAPNTAANAIYVGYMILRNNANFNTAASYAFYQAGLFRSSGTGGAGGGGGATTLAGLTDVSLSSLTYGDLLSYNASTGLWNNTHTLSGSYTLSGSLTTNDGLSVQTVTASFISASGGITGSLLGTASYATTASYALNGGVTQLLGGPGITLSPTNGLGQVTITSTGGGGVYGNTATGSYGSFYDTGTYPVTSTTTAYSMSLNTTDISNGVLISGSTNPYVTYIKVQNSGIYNLQFSTQFENANANVQDIQIWLRKNGTDLSWTNSRVTLPAKHGIVNGRLIPAWNWFLSLNANDYVQIMYQADSTDVSLASVVAGTNPTTPQVPAVIATVSRIDQFLSNTGSFSGSFIGSHTGSFTGSFTGSLFGNASTSTVASNITKQNFSSFPGTYYPLITTGIGAVNPNGITSSFSLDTSTNTLNTTASYAISSSYALSASWAPGGGGVSPGGTNGSIQYNDGVGGFGGDSKLTYDSTFHKMYLDGGEDFTLGPYNINNAASVIIKNDKAGFSVYPSITSNTVKINANSAGMVITFTALDTGVLKINGFKCDYSLDTNDGSSYESRVGTLLCALSNDTGFVPNIVDSSITGVGLSSLKSDSIIFYTQWNTDNVEIWADCSNVDYDVFFTGLFTFFNHG